MDDEKEDKKQPVGLEYNLEEAINTIGFGSGQLVVLVVAG